MLELQLVMSDHNTGRGLGLILPTPHHSHDGSVLQLLYCTTFLVRYERSVLGGDRFLRRKECRKHCLNQLRMIIWGNRVQGLGKLAPPWARESLGKTIHWGSLSNTRFPAFTVGVTSDLLATCRGHR